MSNTVKILFKCKRCGRAWERTVDELDRPDPPIYRGVDATTKTYRDTCPDCTTWVVVEVQESGGRHA